VRRSAEAAGRSSDDDDENNDIDEDEGEVEDSADEATPGDLILNMVTLTEELGFTREAANEAVRRRVNEIVQSRGCTQETAVRWLYGETVRRRALQR